MKNIFFKIAIAALLTFNFINFQTAFAQVPQAINFQAIARDGSGNPMVNTNIQIRLSVVDSAQSGTIVYQELRALQTNAYGSFSFLIGVNPAFTTIGTFTEINWETGNKHLKIDYDPTNTFSFSLTLGTIRFVTVPYAFSAETVAFIDATNAQNGDVLVYNSTTGKFEPGQVSASTVQWSNVQNKPNFATVATSGSYNDLTNQPIIDGSETKITTGTNVTITGTGTTTSPYVINSTSSNIQGVTTGDLQYWNGTNWVILQSGSVGQVLSINSSNIPTWKNPSALVPPTVITSNANTFSGNYAKAGGSILNDGSSPIIDKGLCWSTSPNPTIANNKVHAFDSTITNLSINTMYYVRAYATNDAGTGYGNEISFNSGQIIGSTYAGGLVFYNDGTGHGLVCAHADQSTGAIYGCGGTLLGGTLTSINSGAANTNIIVAGCSTAGTAAKLCYDLVLNGYNDWYLPSKDELNKMCYNLRANGLGGFTNNWYWSSSEYDSGAACCQSFSNGFQDCGLYQGDYYPNKNIAYYVRAARSF